LALRKSLNVNDLIFQTVEDGLEHCVTRLREHIWQADLSNALSDSAEAAKISRRIYSLIEQHISASAPHKAAPTKDDPCSIR
jgi:hypothetical protein